MSISHESWTRLRNRRTSADPQRAAEIRAETQLAIELGQRVYDLRTALGWTQTRLAREASMRQPHIARIEAGGMFNPTVDTLRRLAGALGTEVHVTLSAGGEHIVFSPPHAA